MFPNRSRTRRQRPSTQSRFRVNSCLEVHFRGSPPSPRAGRRDALTSSASSRSRQRHRRRHALDVGAHEAARSRVPRPPRSRRCCTASSTHPRGRRCVRPQRRERRPRAAEGADVERRSPARAEAPYAARSTRLPASSSSRLAASSAATLYASLNVGTLKTAVDEVVDRRGRRPSPSGRRGRARSRRCRRCGRRAPAACRRGRAA